MLVFTGPDKALLDRAARILDGLAKATGWESIEDKRKRKSAKEQFDRLTRDARDLRMLAARLKGVEKVLQFHKEQRDARVDKTPMMNPPGTTAGVGDG